LVDRNETLERPLRRSLFFVPGGEPRKLEAGQCRRHRRVKQVVSIDQEHGGASSVVESGRRVQEALPASSCSGSG